MLFFVARAVHPQALNETKLRASDGSLGDRFGFATALTGSYALMGAPGYRTERGAAYLFQRTVLAGENAEWRELAKLVASDGTNEDFFGGAVALSADYALIGARNDNQRALGTGAAYVFKHQDSTWRQLVKLATRTGETNEHFGSAVTLGGDYALIGAPGERSDRGAAYIFKRTGEVWQEQARLQASAGASEDFFGIAVALAEDYAFISAHGDDDRGSNAGAVYIFRREQSNGGEAWVEKLKLKAADGEVNDFFGVALAAAGRDLVIGAYGDDDRANHAGAAYIFSREESGGVVNWRQQAKLLASDGAADDDFGSAVALLGDFALAGGLMQFSQGNGAAYLFKREQAQWHELLKLTAGDGEANDRFGNAVALSDDAALIGARFEDEKGNEAGAAYLYEGLAQYVGVAENDLALPAVFALEQNYPNPFNPATAIEFSLARAGFVTLKIYDTQGVEVAALVARPLAAGRHRVSWHAGRSASGVYFYRLQAGPFVRTKKLVVLQ